MSEIRDALRSMQADVERTEPGQVVSNRLAPSFKELFERIAERVEALEWRVQELEWRAEREDDYRREQQERE